MKKIRNMPNKKICLIALAILWLLLCMVVTPVYTTVTLTYADDPAGEVITTVYAGIRGSVSPSDAQSRIVNSGVARISFQDFRIGKRCSLKRIDPVDQAYEDGTLTLSRVTVCQNGILTIDLMGEELRGYFTGNEQVQFTDGNDFTFAVTGEDPQLLPTAAFQELYTAGHLSVFLAAYFIYGAAAVLLFALCSWLLRQVREYTIPGKLAFGVFLAGLLGAAFLCIYTGLRSPFWLNPDEYEVKAAVLYYFSHLMPPDIRSELMTNSFSVYGTSRHFEWNLFYLYAGKIGQFFSDAAVQIRLFSLLLFCIMTGITIRNIKKNYALLFLLLLTPQVWYLFSYCTSDAMDYFLGFLAIYELIEENSMLNRLFRENFTRRHLFYYGLLGLLFAHLLWAKASFYPVLVFFFLILLIRLSYEGKEKRGTLLRRYLILAGLTLGIFVIRYMITDFPYYGLDKAGAIAEVTEQQAEYAYKPSTPVMEQAYSISFHAKGVTLKELLTQYDFNKNLFRTFAGFFGSYAFGEEDWYYIIMGILYIALLIRIIIRFRGMKDRQKWWEFAAAAFVCCLQYVLIVYRAWFIDFQPQGRYLLPILFYITYLISRIDRLREDKMLRTILVCTCLLSLYCFIDVGIPNLVPDRVVLP